MTCKPATEEVIRWKIVFPLYSANNCDSEDLGVGWQHGEGLVTFKYHGLLGNRLKYIICRRCGAVLYQCVAEPHRYPPVR